MKIAKIYEFLKESEKELLAGKHLEIGNLLIFYNDVFDYWMVKEDAGFKRASRNDIIRILKEYKSTDVKIVK